MKDQLDGFLLQIPDLANQLPATVIDYFVFFLTVIQGEPHATPAAVERCFEISKIQKYSNIASYLSRNAKRSKGKTPKYIKTKSGYHLERSAELDLQKTLHSGPARQETSHLLRSLLAKVRDPRKKSFLQEAIDCYEIGARRASILLGWILTVDHLYELVLTKHVTAFNAVLSANTDKRVKVTSVSSIDDFADIPESKFIEFLRSSGVISNDVRKILDTKLGIRNSSAHPSAIIISEVKATDFIIDLVDNVIAKYEL